MMGEREVPGGRARRIHKPPVIGGRVHGERCTRLRARLNFQRSKSHKHLVLSFGDRGVSILIHLPQTIPSLISVSAIHTPAIVDTI